MLTSEFFCVGMRRAGSTLQAQLVAALVGRASIRLTTAEWMSSFLAETRSSDRPVVVKAHRADGGHRDVRTEGVPPRPEAPYRQAEMKGLSRASLTP
jgi:hypothetical protein